VALGLRWAARCTCQVGRGGGEKRMALGRTGETDGPDGSSAGLGRGGGGVRERGGFCWAAAPAGPQ
jgi:hypothetical protein